MLRAVSGSRLFSTRRWCFDSSRVGPARLAERVAGMAGLPGLRLRTLATRERVARREADGPLSGMVRFARTFFHGPASLLRRTGRATAYTPSASAAELPPRAWRIIPDEPGDRNREKPGKGLFETALTMFSSQPVQAACCFARARLQHEAEGGMALHTGEVYLGRLSPCRRTGERSAEQKSLRMSAMPSGVRA